MRRMRRVSRPDAKVREPATGRLAGRRERSSGRTGRRTSKRDRNVSDDLPLWGLATSVDIYHCDARAIRDAEKIKQFVAELCELIEMKRFGETQVVHFGEEERVAGYSMVQLIETSLISAHFANMTNAVYLDVFSCKKYDPNEVAEFARSSFGGSHCITHVTPRI